MLSTIFSQLTLGHTLSLLFYILLSYLLLSMFRQTTLFHFLGYKTLFLIYLGWWLVSLKLDILALILWIVYGSLIVVFFIFAFFWLHTPHTPPAQKLSPKLQALTTNIIITLTTLTGLNALLVYKNILFVTPWINYYELCYLHNSEEIESLGWTLSINNPAATLLISLALTLTCLTAIAWILNSKKNKWTTLKRRTNLVQPETPILATGVRRQTPFLQDYRQILGLNYIDNYNLKWRI